MNPIEIPEIRQLPFQINGGDKKAAGTEEGSFFKYLTNSMDQVNERQLEADDAVKEMASGEKVDIHNTMITMQKASLSLDLMMQVRNKIIAAYDEIRRMNI